MKIWFDLTNSPHIHFFRDMIRDLEKEGHEVVITSRDAANTLDLLELYGMKYHIVGRYYGVKLLHKLIGTLGRVWQLRNFVRKNKIDVGISQSSFASAMAGFLAGVPTIYTNDNEHALGNKVSFLFATHIFIPEFIPVSKVTNLFVRPQKVTQYPGVKEGIYLWHKYMDFKKEDSNCKKIYYRPEPYYAQYYKGKINFLDAALNELKNDYDITILPRDKKQIEHYLADDFLGIHVCKTPLPFDEIARDCFLFIGAGGTMTREMAVIGIPTISVYQDELLDVDKYLISIGLMTHQPDLTAHDIRKAMDSLKGKAPDLSLMKLGIEAYSMIKNKLLELKRR